MDDNLLSEVGFYKSLLSQKDFDSKQFYKTSVLSEETWLSNGSDKRYIGAELLLDSDYYIILRTDKRKLIWKDEDNKLCDTNVFVDPSLNKLLKDIYDTI